MKRIWGDEGRESKPHKMTDGTDKGRSVYADHTSIKVEIDFLEAKCSFVLAETTYSTMCAWSRGGGVWGRGLAMHLNRAH